MKLSSRGNRCRTFLHYHPEILDQLLEIQAETGKPFKRVHDRNTRALEIACSHPYAMYIAAHVMSKHIFHKANLQGFFSAFFDKAAAERLVVLP